MSEPVTQTFDDLGLSEATLRAVKEGGYNTPTPIQAQAIPEVLKGLDILGIAQTGTGKTAAFVLPMIDILAAGRARARMPRTLILEPTRELAAQVAENFDKYGKYQKLTKALLIGGVSFGDQDALLARGVGRADRDSWTSRADRRLPRDRAALARRPAGGELDSLTANSDDRDFELVAEHVREAIEKNQPEGALDRLHTFVIKFIRIACEPHGIEENRDKALHSIFGEYVKALREGGHLESQMAERILKSSISVLESFNDVRNNKSLAHDNPILNYEESLLIFNHVRGVDPLHQGA